MWFLINAGSEALKRHSTHCYVFPSCSLAIWTRTMFLDVYWFSHWWHLWSSLKAVCMFSLCWLNTYFNEWSTEVKDVLFLHVLPQCEFRDDGCMLWIAYRTIFTHGWFEDGSSVFPSLMLYSNSMSIGILFSQMKGVHHRKNLLMTNIMVQCVLPHLQDRQNHQEVPPRHQDALHQGFYPLLCEKENTWNLCRRSPSLNWSQATKPSQEANAVHGGVFMMHHWNYKILPFITNWVL